MMSNKFLCTIAFALTVTWNGSPAGAGIFFGDGGTHSISGPSPDVTLANNTTLLVDTGAAITGGLGVNGITGINSNVVLSGGSVTGGATNPSANSTPSGISLRGGFFTATGGAVTGGASSVIGGDGVDLISATATIRGGTFSAASSFAPGFGLSYINFGAGNLLSISGGTFIGGGPNGSEAAVLTLGFGSASISGGTFKGTGATQVLGASLANGAQLNISGGSFAARISASVTGVSGGSLNFFGTGLAFTPFFTSASAVEGLLSGTLSDGETLRAQDVFFLSQNGYQIRSGADELSFISPNSSAVPEPASVLMVGVGLTVVGLASRRSYRSNRLREVSQAG